VRVKRSPIDRAAAADWLFEHHFPAMVRIAYRLAGDTELAQDLAQEAVLLAWRDWERIGAMESVGGYLRDIVVNLARNSLRRRVLELRHRFTEVSTPKGPTTTRWPGRARSCASTAAGRPTGPRTGARSGSGRTTPGSGA
jgi:DNA-directed RNA polymerase specialized sigma24 family protein